jgi:hypothetical protein
MHDIWFSRSYTIARAMAVRKCCRCGQRLWFRDADRSWAADGLVREATERQPRAVTLLTLLTLLTQGAVLSLIGGRAKKCQHRQHCHACGSWRGRRQFSSTVGSNSVIRRAADDE